MNGQKNLSQLTLSQIEERGLTHLLNRPKVRKAGPGRPKEKLNKRNQFSLTYWFRLIEKDFKKMRPAQRCRIALECWKVLINKANSIPSDPEESKLNADEAMGILKDVENNGKTSTTTVESDKEPVMVRPNPTTEKTIEMGKVLS